MADNEKRRSEDDIIPAIGEKWFTEFDGEDDDEPAERHSSHTEEPEPEVRQEPAAEPVIPKSIEPEETEPVISQEVFEERVTEGERSPEESLDEGASEEEKTDAEDTGYVPRAENRGAGFTMRTNDDPDRKKRRSRQNELRSGEDWENVRGSIIRLRAQLTVRAAVLLVASVFSLFISIANDLEQPMAAVFDRNINPSAYIFTNTILGIIAVGFSYSSVVNGIKSLFRMSPDSDTLVSLNLIAAIAAGLVTLFDPESLKMGYFHIYTSSAIFLLFVCTLGKLGVVRRTLVSFDFMAECGSLAAVQQAEKGELSDIRTKKHSEIAYLRRTDLIRDVMKNSYSSDLADLFSEKAVPVMMLAAAAMAILSWSFDGHAQEKQEKIFVLMAAISGTLSICSAASLAMISNRPLAGAAKKLLGCGAVILGYSSAEEHAETDTAVMNAAQLFPEGSVIIEDIKLLTSEISEQQAIRLAASLAKAGGSVTAGELEKLLGGESCMPVNGCVTEASMGVSGWIESKRMILGGRTLMERHSISGLPSEAAEGRFAKRRGVVYLSVSGKAVLMFSAELTADRVMRRQIQALEDERVNIAIRSCDAFIKQEEIAQLFDIKVSTAAILPSSCEDELDAMTEPAGSLSASMFCEENAGAFAMLLIAAKRVKYAANLGVAVQYGAMILGIIISVVLMFTGSFAQINPTVIFVYDLIFMLIMKVIQDVKRL